MTQRPLDARLLPFAWSGGAGGRGDAQAALPIYEPAEPAEGCSFPRLVPLDIAEVFRSLLENQAGEHAARMTAWRAPLATPRR